MLEKNRIGEKIFADVSRHLNEVGLMMHGGTIIAANLIVASKSTKNRDGKCDPEMHQTKNSNEWHFGMKVHADADAGSGDIHTIIGTSANIHDVLETSKLLREDGHVMYGDSGYQGVPERPAIKENEVLSKTEFRINKRPSSLKMADNFKGLNWDKKMEHDKSSV